LAGEWLAEEVAAKPDIDIEVLEEIRRLVERFTG
jgi:hypothetical protein